MQEIVSWLISMEQMSGDLYRNAGRFLKDDPVLASRLEHLANDEARHEEIMKKAADHLKRHPLPAPKITLDNASRDKCELPFHENRKRIAAGTLTRESMLDCIVATESSEWNDFFQYVINAMKGEGREFESAASEIEQHRKFIEASIRTFSQDPDRLDRLRQLPKIWDQRILIVDDYEPMQRLIADMLSPEGFVDVASTGKEALEKLTAHHYDLVLTDDFMPGMNGIELYKQSALRDPLVKERFLFLLDDIQPLHRAFIREKGLNSLAKPFSVKEFREAVAAILASTSQKHR